MILEQKIKAVNENVVEWLQDLGLSANIDNKN